MKRLIKYLGILCAMLALVVSACGGNGQNGDNGGETVVVTAAEESIELTDDEIASYDFTALFSITVDGEAADVLPSYVDASAVKAEAGTYTVTCTYGGQSASVTVTVTAAVYTLQVSAKEVTLKASEVSSANFLQYFTAMKDGVKETLTQDMAESTVKAVAGDYTFTVTYHGVSMTLTVHVVSDHSAEVILTVSAPEIPLSKLGEYDYTSLFSLYVDGVAVQVTSAMVTAASEGKNVGDTFAVTLNYSDDLVTATKTVTAKVVNDAALVITPKNVVTYPNAEAIDLTTLFTITLGGEEIPVTNDMITGFIDYSKTGDNIITLTYGGKSAEATVSVKLGVIIDYAKGDTVAVRVGTDKDSYPFADDFIVIINGARYRRIPDSCLDLSNVDFSKEGTCTAKISISYGDQPKGSGHPPRYPDPEVTEKTITYVVVSADYELTVKEDPVILPRGTASYDPTQNIQLTVNGYKQGFTTNKEWANVINVYYEVLSEIDFTSAEMQEVRLALYVYGAESDPVIASFHVQVETELSVSATDRIAFTGETLFTRDLFTVTVNGEAKAVPQENITGKVDTFTPGVYYVTLSYEGLTATAKVVVYERDLIGTYRTSLTTIPVEEEDDDEDIEGGWGDYYDPDELSLDTPMAIAEAPSPLGALTVKADGSIRFNGISVYSVTGIDEKTMILHTGVEGRGNDYTLYYDNGVVVLDPENRTAMNFSDQRRPLVYFQDTIWAMQEKLTVNAGDGYVLQKESVGYFSIDATRLKSKEDDSELWYGLYVKLLVASNGDHVYEVKWGPMQFVGAYSSAVGDENTVTFCGESYHFAMTAADVGNVVKDTTRPYTGKSFSGTVGGKAATLQINNQNWYELFIGSSLVLRVYPNDLSNMKNGGELADGRVFLYDLGNADYGTYSYMFDLDTEAGTFTLEERDSYFGVYDRGKLRLFLDGYGTGHFYEDNTGRVYSSTKFSYTVKNSELYISFITDDPKFSYGKEAAFFVSPLLNVLTPKSSEGGVFAGEDFENTLITDGAIVKVNVTMATNVQQLNEGVSIVTKDGPVSAADIGNFLDVSCVNFSKAGFYDFTVTVTVRGEEVSSHYAVQVFPAQYKNDPLVGSYGNGVLYGTDITLRLDEYGRAYVVAGNVTYSGTFSIAEDRKSFVVKAYSPADGFVSVKATVLADGVIRAECDGMLHFTDYFVIGGQSSVAGTDGYVIRRLGSGDNTVYIAFDGSDAAGEVVTVTLEGDVYTITQGESVRHAKIAWGNDPASGLSFVD